MDEVAVREEIVVTARRTPQRGDTVTGPVTVIDGERLRNAAQLTVDDVLRQAVAGFGQFRRSSALSSNPTTQGASLRGVGATAASRALVLLDGWPVNDPFGGWVPWTRIPILSVERVEVVHGARSDVWGSGALGGVIHVLTRRAGDEPSASAELIFGSDRTWRAGGSGSGRLGSLALQADVSHLQTDGAARVREDQRGAIDEPVDARASQAYLTARRTLCADSEASAVVHLFDEERGNGTPLTRNASSGGRLGLAWTRRTPAGVWDTRLQAQLQSFSASFSAQAADRSSETPALNQFDVPAEMLAAHVQFARANSVGHAWSAGADVRLIDAETNEDFLFNGSEFERRRRAGGEQTFFGVYATDQIDVGSHWSVEVGARADGWWSSNGFRREIALADGSELRNEAFARRRELLVSARAGARRNLGTGLRARTSIFAGYRAPTINEQYRPFRVGNDITAPNAALEPERLHGVDAGLDFVRQDVFVQTSVFHQRIDDVVANVTVGAGPGTVDPCGFVPSGGVCRQRRNVERARTYGWQARIGWTPVSRVSLTADWITASSRFADAVSAAEIAGLRLPQVPRHRATVDLDAWLTDRWSLHAQIRWAGDRPEDDRNARFVAAYAATDAALRWNGPGRWSASLRATNLTDETIEVGVSAAGLVTVGDPRRVTASLSWSLR